MRKALWLIIMTTVIGGLVFSPVLFYANAQAPLTPTPPPVDDDEVIDDDDDTPEFPEEKIEEFLEEVILPKVSDLAISPLFSGLEEESRGEIKDISLEGLEFPSEED